MTEEVKRGKTPLYRKVSEEIRRDIVSGIYVPGEILPSIRDKAKSLGVARNTVDTAYQILAEEGYIRSRRGVGYEVLDYRETFNFDMDAGGESQEAASVTERPDISIDFGSSKGMTEWFNEKNWSRFSEKLYTELQEPAEIAGLRLRQQIRRYLKKHRGITCSDEQIFLYRDYRQAMDRISRIRPNLLYTLPHHEGYLGDHISEEEGRMLLSCIREKDVYMVEDDLDSEFVYGKRPYGTLFEEDTDGRVILTGTFERTLGSFIQIRYVVYPKRLIEENRQLFTSVERGTNHSLIEIRGLGVLMESQSWENYLRKMNHKYEKKRDLLVDKIRRSFGGDAVLYRTESGPEIIAVFPYSRDAEYFMKKALEKGVKVSARNGHNTPGTNRRLYVTLNYSSVPYEKIEEGIDILTGVLKGSSNP